MGKSSFDDTVWRPGQPLDPTSKTMPGQELTERLLYVEQVLDNMLVGDLPVAALQRELEQSWLPDPQLLLASSSVTREVLAIAWAGGTVGSAGTKSATAAGGPDWSVVRNSAGNYTVTFPAYKNVPLAFATAVTGADIKVTAKTVSTATFVAGTDTDFDWMVWGK